MKYSLRSLMIFVTLVAVAIGGRIEYLRRSAEFHDQEAARCLKKIVGGGEQLETEEDGGFECVLRDFTPEDIKGSVYHSEMAKLFREAIYHPWLPVNEPPELASFMKSRRDAEASPGQRQRVSPAGPFTPGGQRREPDDSFAPAPTLPKG